MKSGKCAVQIIGNVLRGENLVEENMVLEVLEGFQNTSEARKAARKFIAENPMAFRYKIVAPY